MCMDEKDYNIEMGENVTLPFQNNVTQCTMETYIFNSVTQWMWFTVPPIIIIFGTFGNVMTLVVLRRIGFGITNLFLGALAISDLVLLYVGLADAWLHLNFNITLVNLHDITCKLSIYVGYSSGVLSVWLIVAMTVQRALSVVWPHRIHLMCTRRKALSLITGIICFLLILHSHFLYGRGLITPSNSTSPTCDSLTTEYGMFTRVVWSWIDLLSFSLLPFVFLAISNSVLVWKLKASMRNVTLTTGHSDNSGVREKRTSSITVTLIVVSLTFLVLSLPNSIILIIWPYVIEERYSKSLEFRAFADFINFLSTFLWYANSAVNFYIYCLTGNKFRSEIKFYMCGSKMPKTVIETMTLQNSSSFSNTRSTLSAYGQNDEF